MKNDLSALFRLYKEPLSIHQKAYLQHVHEYPCVFCLVNKKTLYEVHAHHELLSVQFAYSKRFTDFTAIPLCTKHHENRHFLGFDNFWKQYPSLPFKVAQKMLSEFITVDVQENFCDDVFLNRKKFDNLLYRVLTKLLEREMEYGQKQVF
jgi:hypothetical protein